MRGDTNLAVFVRFANVEERASAALVLFTTHDGVHRTRRAVEKDRRVGLSLCSFSLSWLIDVCVSMSVTFTRTRGSLLESQSRTCNRGTRHTRYGTLPDSRYTE